MTETDRSHAQIFISEDKCSLVYQAESEADKRLALLDVISQELGNMGFRSPHFNVLSIDRDGDNFSIEVEWPGGTICQPTALDIAQAGDIPPNMEGIAELFNSTADGDQEIDHDT